MNQWTVLTSAGDVSDVDFTSLRPSAARNTFVRTGGTFTRCRFSSMPRKFEQCTFIQCLFTGKLAAFENCTFDQCTIQPSKLGDAGFVNCKFRNSTDLIVTADAPNLTMFLCSNCEFDNCTMTVQSVLFARDSTFRGCSRVAPSVVQNARFRDCVFTAYVTCNQAVTFERCTGIQYVHYVMPTCVRFIECPVTKLNIRNANEERYEQVAGAPTMWRHVAAFILTRCRLRSSKVHLCPEVTCSDSTHANTDTFIAPLHPDLATPATGFELNLNHDEAVYPFEHLVLYNKSVHFIDCVPEQGAATNIIVRAESVFRTLTLTNTPVALLRFVAAQDGAALYNHIDYTPDYLTSHTPPPLHLINPSGTVFMEGVRLQSLNYDYSFNFFTRPSLELPCLTADYANVKTLSTDFKFTAQTRIGEQEAELDELQTRILTKDAELVLATSAASGRQVHRELQTLLREGDKMTSFLNTLREVHTYMARMMVYEVDALPPDAVTTNLCCYWYASAAEMQSKIRTKLNQLAIHVATASDPLNRKPMPENLQALIPTFMRCFDRIGTIMYAACKPGISSFEIDQLMNGHDHLDDAALNRVNHLIAYYNPMPEPPVEGEGSIAMHVHRNYSTIPALKLQEALDAVPADKLPQRNEPVGTYIVRRMFGRIDELRAAASGSRSQGNAVQALTPLEVFVLKSKVGFIGQNLNKLHQSGLQLSELQLKALHFALSGDAGFVLLFINSWVEDVIGGYPTFIAEWDTFDKREDAVLRANYRAAQDKNFGTPLPDTTEWPEALPGETVEAARMRAIRAWMKTGTPLTQVVQSDPGKQFLLAALKYANTQVPPIALEDLRTLHGVYELPLVTNPTPEQRERGKLALRLAGMSCGPGTLERLVVKLRDELSVYDQICQGTAIVNANRIVEPGAHDTGDTVHVWVSMETNVAARTVCEAKILSVTYVSDEESKTEDVLQETKTAEPNPKRARRATAEVQYEVQYVTRLTPQMAKIHAVLHASAMDQNERAVALFTSKTFRRISKQFFYLFSETELDCFLKREDQQFWATVLIFMLIKRAFDEAGIAYADIYVPLAMFKQIGAKLLLPYETVFKDMLSPPPPGSKEGDVEPEGGEDSEDLQGGGRKFLLSGGVLLQFKKQAYRRHSDRRRY